MDPKHSSLSDSSAHHALPAVFTDADAAALLGTFSPPPAYTQPLRLPVCLPQTVSGYDSPFARAYCMELSASGVELTDWLKFIDGLNIAIVRRPILARANNTDVRRYYRPRVLRCGLSRLQPWALALCEYSILRVFPELSVFRSPYHWAILVGMTVQVGDISVVSLTASEQNVVVAGRASSWNGKSCKVHIPHRCPICHHL
jgi:hypothetical protein